MKIIAFSENFGYICTRPGRIDFCFHGTFWNRSKWNRSGTDPNGSITAVLQVQFWIRLDPFRTRSRTVPYKQKACPVRFRTGSIWNRSRVNIAFDTAQSYFQCRVSKTCHLCQRFTQSNKILKAFRCFFIFAFTHARHTQNE